MSVPEPVGDPNEPDLSFASALHKVRWAEQRIRNVEANIEMLRNEYVQRGGLTVSDDGQSTSLENFVIPADVLCEIGDAVFNLRSALDCCWMGLRRAIDAGQTKGTLPRAVDRNGTEGEIRKFAIEGSFPGVTSMLLDKVSPYKHGNETLWFVGQVDNWNKHNMLVVVAQVSTFNGGFRHYSSGGYSGLNNVSIVGFDNGIPAIKLPVSANRPDEKPNVAIDIILKSRVPPDERDLMPFLRTALIDTRESVNCFVCHFGKKSTDG